MNAVSGDVTSLTGRVSANETAINTLNGEQDTQDLAIKAAADAAAAAQGEVDALEGKVGTVAEGKTVVQMIEDAKSAATNNNTAVTGRLDAIEAEQLTQNAAIEAAQAAAETADGKAVAADTKAQTAQNEVDALETNVANNYVAWTDVDDSYAANEYTF
jgi:chromosome segregation ATPase